MQFTACVLTLEAQDITSVPGLVGLDQAIEETVKRARLQPAATAQHRCRLAGQRAEDGVSVLGCDMTQHGCLAGAGEAVKVEHLPAWIGHEGVDRAHRHFLLIGERRD